jgi:hypothetical protein
MERLDHKGLLALPIDGQISVKLIIRQVCNEILAQQLRDIRVFFFIINWSRADSIYLQRTTSLCTSDEDVYFSCEIEDTNEPVSIFAAGSTSPNDGYVQYRYGTNAKIDFQYPAARVPSGNHFSIVDVSRSAAGTGTHLKFKNGDYQYVVSNALVPGEVYVVRKGKIVFDKACKGTEYIPYSEKARQGVPWGTLDITEGLDNH